MSRTVGDHLASFRTWLAGRIAPVSVVVEAGVEDRDGTGVFLRLLGVEPGRLERGGGERQAVDIYASLTARAPDPLEAATAAGEIVFALSDHAWTEPEDGVRQPLEIVDAAEGRFAGAANGRHGVQTIIRLPLVRERVRPAARAVLRPLQVEITGTRPISGVVLGARADDAPVPLAGARVTAPAFGRTAVSDAAGRFRLDGLPSAGPVAVTVEARGRTRPFAVDAGASPVLTVPVDER